MKKYLFVVCLLFSFVNTIQGQERGRIRDFGIKPGILTPGKLNAITDVKGVSVGQKTMIIGDSIRTGVTVVLPHQGNIFQQKVPAAVYVGNGFGKGNWFYSNRRVG